MPNKLTLSKMAVACALITSAHAASANTVEITPYIDYVITDELELSETGQTLDVDDVAAIGFAIAWPESQLGQGQISVSYGNYDYEATNNQSGDLVEGDFDVIYAHFSGVAHYRQPNYTTTVSVGIGGTYFSADRGDNSIYPSITGAIGTRYDLSQALSIVTELRAYGTFADDNSKVFCESGPEGANCFGQFDGSFWVDAAVRFGLAYRF